MPTQEATLKTIDFIVNPNSGKKDVDAALTSIREAMDRAGIEGEVSVTEKAGDGKRLAKAALKKGVDAVGVCGGDGTILEVAVALIGSDVPLFLVPGGSANVLATEFSIPKDIEAACALLTDSTPLEIKAIDAARFGDGYCISRASLGFEAEMVKGADRELKKKTGVLAYFIAAIGALKRIKRAVYLIRIDGKEYQTRGLTCIVTNVGNMGFTETSLDKRIDAADGLLDVLVVRKANFRFLRHCLATLVRRERPEDRSLVAHWQGKDVHVTSKPAQIVECDGEIVGKGSFHAQILPAAVKILVPKK